MFSFNWLEDYIKAGCSEITEHELYRFSRSEDYRIRLRVAENKATPGKILKHLAMDPHPDVRSAVAVHPNLPVRLRWQLATDSDPSVRFAIAEDYAAQKEILEALAEDLNPYVSVRARKTLESCSNVRPEHSMLEWPVESRPRYA